MSRAEVGRLNDMGEGLPKPTRARFAVAENLKRLMAEYRNPDSGVKGIGSRELARKAPKISYKTIDRMLDPYHPTSPNLDSMDAVAHVFKLDTFELLVRRPMLQGSEPRPAEVHPVPQEIPKTKKRFGR